MYVDPEFAQARTAVPSWTPGPVEAIASGTAILTLEGMKPVEVLEPGERIVTRAGARTLRSVMGGDGGYYLGFDEPAVVLAENRQIRTRPH